MPKENKGVRRNKLKRSDTKSSATSKLRDSLRSFMLGSESNRYSPFQREPLLRRERMEERDSATLTEVQGYNTKNLIGNGIKYIMFPLHLLHFCLFGSLSSSVSCPVTSDSPDDALLVEKKPKKEEKNEERKKKEEKKEDQKEKQEENRDEKSSVKEKSKSPARSSRNKSQDEPPRESSRVKVKEEPRSSESGKEDQREPAESVLRKDEDILRKEAQKEVQKVVNENDSMDDMVTAAEDSDYSSDHWCSATSSINLDMSVDNLEDLDKCRSLVFEEPMDISMEEQCLDRSVSCLRSPLQRRLLDKDRSFSVSLDERKPGYSMDEEIAEIFRRKCVSSDEEYSSRVSKRPTEKIRDNDRRYCAQCRKSVASPRRSSRKEKEDNGGEERRKKKSSNDPGTPREGKATKNEGERYNSSQSSPGKRRSRSSATPVKRKESRREEARYRERGTQTDSAFSDEDVEMIPVEGRSEKKSHGRIRKSYGNIHQVEEMDQDLEYIADNEDSCDGFRRSARRRIFSDSGSSSSADLGFDDDRKSPNCRQDRKETTSGRGHHGSGLVGRAPPGFPEVPQNPPLTSNGDRLAPGIGPRNVSSFRTVAPAPSPMRHLYYDYPEFMDLPVNVNRSKILRNILRDNYSQ